MEKTFDYKELNKLYEIQILQNKDKQGVSIKEIAKELNKDEKLVYNQCYKYKRKGFLKIFGKKKNKKVVITKWGINRITWIRKMKGEITLKQF